MRAFLVGHVLHGKIIDASPRATSSGENETRGSRIKSVPWAETVVFPSPRRWKGSSSGQRRVGDRGDTTRSWRPDADGGMVLVHMNEQLLPRPPAGGKHANAVDDELGWSGRTARRATRVHAVNRRGSLSTLHQGVIRWRGAEGIAPARELLFFSRRVPAGRAEPFLGRDDGRIFEDAAGRRRRSSRAHALWAEPACWERRRWV